MQAKPVLIAVLATCAALSIGLSDPARAETALPNSATTSAGAERTIADQATRHATAAAADLSAQKRKPAKASKKAKAAKKPAKSKGGKGHLGHH